MSHRESQGLTSHDWFPSGIPAQIDGNSGETSILACPSLYLTLRFLTPVNRLIYNSACPIILSLSEVIPCPCGMRDDRQGIAGLSQTGNPSFRADSRTSDLENEAKSSGLITPAS